MEREELIEQYLANNLSEADKLAFEKQLENSVALKKQVELNRQIIDGIKEARAEELKAMLSNIVISGPMSVSSGKAALATLSVGLVGLVLYFSIRTKKPEQENIYTKIDSTSNMAKPESIAVIPLYNSQMKDTEDNINAISVPPPIEHNTSNTQPLDIKVVKKSIKPPVPLTDDSYALESLKTSSGERTDSRQSTPWSTDDIASKAAIEVALDTHNKKYSFHYRCLGNKLFLYGSFVENLYELIEVSSKDSVLYLYYGDEYYYINKKETKIVSFKQVEDNELLKKLSIYQGR